MSTCLLSVVIDWRDHIPRLYHVVCLNPRLVSEPCSYHDGLSLPPSPYPTSPHPPSPHPTPSYPTPLYPISAPYPTPPHITFSPTSSNLFSTPPGLISTSISTTCSGDEEDDDDDSVFISELQSALKKPSNLWPSSQTNFKEDGDELQWKLLQRRATVDQLLSPEPSRGIPTITITPSDSAVTTPLVSRNTEFAFEDMLDFWKSVEYTKVKLGFCGLLGISLFKSSKSVILSLIFNSSRCTVFT